MVGLGKFRQQVFPGVPKFRKPMQKQNQRPFALLHVMQADAVHLGIRVLRSRCRGTVAWLHLSSVWAAFNASTRIKMGKL